MRITSRKAMFLQKKSSTQTLLEMEIEHLKLCVSPIEFYLPINISMGTGKNMNVTIMGLKHMTISGCSGDTASGFSFATLHDGIGISL